MRVLVTADWHFDNWLRADTDPFGRIADVLETLDALIIAGDLSNDPRNGWSNLFGYLEYLISLEKVWVIPGNHDYYSWDLHDDQGLAAIAAKSGVNFAQKQTVTIGGNRFLCCTLWTDFALTGDVAGAMAAARRIMLDYSRIAVGPSRHRLDPEHLLALHVEHLAWLDAELCKPFAGRTFVVTHHAPHRAVAGPIDAVTPAFASDLDDLIRLHQPDAWFFGHTHRWLEARIGRTLIRNVSLGYPGEVDPAQERTLLLRGLIGIGAPT